MPSYVVTGAARGIGLEFVNQFSAQSDNVVFALVRNIKTAGTLQALGRANVHIIEADITDVKALKLAAQEVTRITGGKLDVLINNAALIDFTHFGLHLDQFPEETILEEDLRKNFNVNVIGVIHTTNVFLPLLHEGSTKKVVTLGSPAGDTELTLAADFSNNVPYSISKAAVNMAVAKYAVAHKKDGFVFLALSPGIVATQQIFDDDAAESFAGIQKLYPNFTGPITPEESVRLMRKVIEESTVKDTGAFISHKGNKEWL